MKFLLLFFTLALSIVTNGKTKHFDHDAEGNLQSMRAGNDWQAEWKRNRAGLELYRELSGGVRVRTERDRFGREIRKSVGVRNIERSGRQFQWGAGNRLLGIYDEETGKRTNFDYDAFDNLIKAEYQEGVQVSTIYRVPDAIGNLFEARYRNDRKYDRGGRLTEDPNYFYYYDCEGNLIFKEFKKPQGYSSLNRAALQKKYGIRFKATATGWLYEWSAGGMLERVVNPQQGKVTFGYDALGRRVYKEVKHTRTRWLWDGNVPLHEWQETEREPLIDMVTWVFEEGSFVPAARITGDGSQSIVTDYLGTPVQMYNAKGEKTWEADLDIYGKVRTFAGRSLSDCPFRYQGQYEDNETGLYYNRFRYYDPSIGSYISQDPIGLVGSNPTLYGYVTDTNSWIDVLGLFNDLKPTGDGHHLFPRSIGDKLGIRDIIEKVSWYPNVSRDTAILLQELHAKLKETGIPIHGSMYEGTIDEALDAMDNAYKSFDTKGYLMIDGKRYDNLTPSEAMIKVRQHVESKIKASYQ